MDAVGADRLLALAKHLKTVERNQFDYAHWFRKLKDPPAQVRAGYGVVESVEISCGTKGCALGHAAMMPRFRRLGMRLFSQPGAFNGHVGKVLKNGRRSTLSGLQLAMQVFHLDALEAHELFMPQNHAERYWTPLKVARKIERFVQRELDGSRA